MKNLIKGLTTMSFIFVLSMMFGIVNVSALEATGNCGANGDNVTWTYDETTSTVTLSGTGAMKDYRGDSPFRLANISNLVIEKGVTSVGTEAFIESHLTSVTIPNSVTKIGECAFMDSQLTNVTIPDSVTTIGGAAFNGNKLTSVTIPNSVTTIGIAAFMNNKLAGVTIPNSVITIGAMSFQSNQLTSITIPNSVTAIGFNAFANNSTLIKAIILNDSADMIIGDTDYDVFQDVSSDFKLYGYANSSTSTYATNSGTAFVELKKITNSMISDITTQYYKGIALTPVIKVNDGTKDLVFGTDYEVSYKDNDKAGTATVIITGKGYYEYSEISKTFTIAKQQYSVSINPLTGATITPSDTINIDYDGSQKYTIKANDGYKITSILVDGVEMLSSLKDDVLTISNPTKNMNVEVKTEEVKEEVSEPVKDTPTDEVKEDNPKTFDGILLYVGLGILSVLGLSGTGLYIKKRHN